MINHDVVVQFGTVIVATSVELFFTEKTIV
jgi:hypothetical protein